MVKKKTTSRKPVPKKKSTAKKAASRKAAPARTKSAASGGRKPPAAKKRSSARRKKSKGLSSAFIASIFACVFILGIVSVFLVDRYTDLDLFKSPPATRAKVDNGYKTAKVIKPTPVRPPTLKPSPVTPTPPPVPLVKPRFKVAIVIDDMGQNLSGLNGLLALDAPITVAVLPYLKYSTTVAEKAHKRGWDVLLHAPMEPKDSGTHNAGKGALLTSMSKAEIKAKLLGDIKMIPHATGVNNHMGSKFTEDEVRMKVVLEVLKEKNLFFFDSRTTAASVGKRLAKKLGVKNAERSIFLDNEQDVKYIKGQIEKLVKSAERNGTAIAIGHPYKETIAALKEVVPGLAGRGVEVVKLSELVK